MSARNGDRARFHLARKQRLHRRQRVAELVASLRVPATASAAPAEGVRGPAKKAVPKAEKKAVSKV
jgi:hypothetical protein